jgi:hypothetical protein
MGKQRFRLVLCGLLLLAIPSITVAPAEAQKTEYRVVLLSDVVSSAAQTYGVNDVSEGRAVGAIVPDQKTPTTGKRSSGTSRITRFSICRG